MAKFTAIPKDGNMATRKFHPIIAFHLKRKFFEQFKTIHDYSPSEIQLAKSLKVLLPGVTQEELNRIPPCPDHHGTPFHGRQTDGTFGLEAE